MASRGLFHFAQRFGADNVVLRDIIPELVFGGIVVAVAAGMAIHQWRSWKQLQHGCADEEEARFAVRRLSRRLQVSALLALVGVMLPIGVWQPFFQKRLLLFLAWWFVVLLLIVWVVLLALGDMLATAVHARVARTHLNRERQRLEDELERYRREQTGEAEGD